MKFFYDATKQRYVADNGAYVQRETGTETPNGNVLSGQWVYRDAAGDFLDYDRYRTDLEGRHKIKLVGENF